MLNLGYDTYHIQTVYRHTLKVCRKVPVQLTVTAVFAKCFYVLSYDSMCNHANVIVMILSMCINFAFV